MKQEQEMNIEGYFGLLRKLAWDFAKRNEEVGFDEFFAEACLAFEESKNRFDENQDTSFIAFIMACVRNQLLNAVQKLRFEIPPSEKMPISDSSSLKNDNLACLLFKEKIQSFTFESQQICKMLFDSPAEYLYCTPKIARGKIRNILRGQGWSWNKIWGSFREIKFALSQIE